MTSWWLRRRQALLMMAWRMVERLQRRLAKIQARLEQLIDGWGKEDAFNAPAFSSGSVDARVPEHWAELVRNRAPWLLRAPRDQVAGSESVTPHGNAAHGTHYDNNAAAWSGSDIGGFDPSAVIEEVNTSDDHPDTTVRNNRAGRVRINTPGSSSWGHNRISRTRHVNPVGTVGSEPIQSPGNASRQRGDDAVLPLHSEDSGFDMMGSVEDALPDTALNFRIGQTARRTRIPMFDPHVEFGNPKERGRLAAELDGNVTTEPPVNEAIDTVNTTSRDPRHADAGIAVPAKSFATETSGNTTIPVSTLWPPLPGEEESMVFPTDNSWPALEPEHQDKGDASYEHHHGERRQWNV